jgi:hypothetical protein
MKITKLSEYGYNEAALGFSLSYNSTIDKAKELLPKFAFGLPGENKFLESIYLWLDVTAPRFWWQEADTYRLSTKQSASTMHTLTKRKLTKEDFESYIPEEYLDDINIIAKNINNGIYTLEYLKNLLPEGFLQRRIWTMNYKCLQNIYNQRHNHRLPQWRYFCEEILKQIDHPEFIVKENIIT